MKTEQLRPVFDRVEKDIKRNIAYDLGSCLMQLPAKSWRRETALRYKHILLLMEDMLLDDNDPDLSDRLTVMKDTLSWYAQTSKRKPPPHWTQEAEDFWKCLKLEEKFRDGKILRWLESRKNEWCPTESNYDKVML